MTNNVILWVIKYLHYLGNNALSWAEDPYSPLATFSFETQNSKKIKVPEKKEILYFTYCVNEILLLLFYLTSFSVSRGVRAATNAFQLDRSH